MMKVINEFIEISDGVKLSTDIYFPEDNAHDKKFPVILERTPYNKKSPSSAEVHNSERWTRHGVAKYFTDRNYVVVFQDCRGRFESTGTFTKYLSEPKDGYETLVWISNQPWCDQNIGTMGLSYSAHTQMASTCVVPQLESLKCMVLDSGGFSNSYLGGIRQGGAFELKQATWAIKQSRPDATDDEVKSWFDELKRAPWEKQKHSPLINQPEYEAYLFDLWERESFDDYWKQMGLYATGYYDNIKYPLPTVIMSSWYDAYVRTTLDNYAEFRHRRNQPVQFIMGPWLHASRHLPHSGDVHFGEDALIEGFDENWLKIRLDWFDQYLKGEQRKVADAYPVKLFIMGGGSGRRRQEDGRLDHGGKWLKTTDFPIPGTKEINYHLRNDKTLAPTSEAAAALTFKFDPHNPVPSLGGSLTTGEYSSIFYNGAFNQKRDRGDVLVFETGKLKSALTVAGEVKVHLNVSSDMADTDFTAKLIDVYPPSDDYPEGYAMNLLDGIFRCKFHESWSSPKPLDNGKRYNITIDLAATANKFSPGHKIRLDISSSNFPKFDINPNTGENPIDATSFNVAKNTVHVGESLSYVTLPIVE